MSLNSKIDRLEELIASEKVILSASVVEDSLHAKDTYANIDCNNYGLILFAIICIRLGMGESLKIWPSYEVKNLRFEYLSDSKIYGVKCEAGLLEKLIEKFSAVLLFFIIVVLVFGFVYGIFCLAGRC